VPSHHRSQDDLLLAASSSFSSHTCFNGPAPWLFTPDGQDDLSHRPACLRQVGHVAGPIGHCLRTRPGGQQAVWNASASGLTASDCTRRTVGAASSTPTAAIAYNHYNVPQAYNPQNRRPIAERSRDSYIYCAKHRLAGADSAKTASQRASMLMKHCEVPVLRGFPPDRFQAVLATADVKSHISLEKPVGYGRNPQHENR
jgi:hypothetical protein